MNEQFNFEGDNFVFPPLYPNSVPDQQYPYAAYPDQPSSYQPHLPIDPLLDPALVSSSFFPPPLLPLPPISSPSSNIRIKIPVMPPTTRGASSRQQYSSPIASGSEYHTSNASMDAEGIPQPEDDQDEDEEQVEYGMSSRGRRIAKKSYQESPTEDDDMGESEGDPLDSIPRTDKRKEAQAADEEEEEETGRYSLRARGRAQVVLSDEGDGEAKIGRYPTRNRMRNGANSQSNGNSRPAKRSNGRSRTQTTSSRSKRTRLTTRRTRSATRNVDDDEDGYVDVPSSGSADGEGSIDEAPVTSPEPEADPDADGEDDAEGDDVEPEQDGKPYALRQRAKINYAIPPPLEEMLPPPKPRPIGNRSHGRHPNRPKPPGWSATGAELSKWMGGAGDESDSDYATRTPRKPYGGIAGAGGSGGIFAGGAGASGSFLPGDIAAAAGTPSNLGKMGDSALADADPLGVNQNVTFDEVGGLDEHINSLKEMTLLPLLYPEVFQQFNLTPPRGVLFHGPPGTGKTLLARALAASCRSNGKGISFFMRKGADCLSKWVGEAERQLRILFEEARNQQPSIIFFDEIDGLAPVRSSKQDQIHASIVSTLLALMDGMDGRGQVIVIGATNRPDAVDPALRRPGRFDREFYFPLPNLEARERILSIMTKGWAGWDNEKGLENAKGLAKLTKGYGGADLRALCTEAALNAVQRRYPQIYKSNDRLLLKPETIQVELRDFMISVKKLIPSSARAVSSAASPLPVQLVPLLQEPLDRIKAVVEKVLPVGKKRSALEEAEWEDVGGSEGALERELLMQSMETMRVYRPRVILHGSMGMGQSYVASAALHHLEGYHIQSLELGSLLSDSARTPEAAIVQLFMEAKRHQPSVVYIPSLMGWCAAVTDTARTTVRAMLDTLSPTDPILLLAVVDGPFSLLPQDVRQWFGPIRENRIALTGPSAPQRDAFFEGLLKDVRRSPIDFPDGVKRKKRVLEELPIAPPLEPRQPSAAELAVQQDNDQRIITLLKYRLGPILSELKRKFKRFTKRAAEEYNYDFSAPRPAPQVEVVAQSVEMHTEPNGVMEVDGQELLEVAVVNQVQIQEQLAQEPPLLDMDLERMNVELYRGRYLTPDDFLDDIRKVVHNANVRINEDPERLFRAQAMLTAAEVSCQDFDPQFRLECQRMAVRERRRRDEFRKSKQQEKAAEQPVQNGEYAPGTRRSARHTGQEPEIAITDPVQLERKLKRQRSNGVETTPSEDENSERAAKKSRTNDEDAGAPGEPQSPTVGGRSMSVRFADEVAPGIQSSEAMPTISEVNTDDVPRRSGFDPTLLNPLSPIDTRTSVPIDPPDNPFSITPSIQDLDLPPTSSAPQSNETTHINGLPAGANIILDYESDHPMEGTQPTEVPEAELQQQVAMEIERSPTPLPDFHINEDAFADLKTYLCDATASLNVEQLEQLRATCLGLVWRYRQDWDRTNLLRELRKEAQEFVQEALLDDMGTAP